MADLPRFKNVCASLRGFNLFKKSAWVKPHAYPGMVVASADAFYFAIDESRILTIIGGAAGGLLSGKMSGKRQYLPEAVASVQEIDVSKLPATITHHHDWPVTWKEGPLIVVPRQAIRTVRTSFWLGGIELELESLVMRVFTPVFQRKRLAKYLQELGWEVEGM